MKMGQRVTNGFIVPQILQIS